MESSKIAKSNMDCYNRCSKGIIKNEVYTVVSEPGANSQDWCWKCRSEYRNKTNVIAKGTK